MSEPCFLVVDKPVGITSHDVITYIRSLLGKVKVGHTGTLDPFATGVLVVAIQSTRWISFLPEEQKEYEATIQLGAKTDTGDVDGTVIEEQPVPKLTSLIIEKLFATLHGPQQQVPPMYSALKVGGKRLYEYAREGQHVEVKPRGFHIFELELLDVQQDRLKFRVLCSKGTYVRTLGEDIAKALGTVGHLLDLRRTRSGDFMLKHAISLEELSDKASGCTEWKQVFHRDRQVRSRYTRRSREHIWLALKPKLISLHKAFSQLPKIQLNQQQAQRVRNGGFPQQLNHQEKWTEPFCLIQNDRLLALAVYKEGTGKILRVALA